MQEVVITPRGKAVAHLSPAMGRKKSLWLAVLVDFRVFLPALRRPADDLLCKAWDEGL